MPFINKTDDFVILDKDFIFHKMPQANSAYVKVYLYIIALSGSACEYSQIASALSMLESDVVNAVKYWADAGVLTESDGAISFGNTIPNETTAPSVSAKEAPISVKKCDYTTAQVSDAVIATPELKDMMAVSEELLQKPLNPSEMETLYWFYDGLGFSPEAILMLIEYCVSKGKPRLSYAEKVALSWCERGLITPKDISRYLRNSERTDEDIKYITDKIGISGRPLANAEEEFFTRWMDEFTMSREMILLAYEYCIMQTGKLSFPYMDKILERWHIEGIFTTAAAEEEHNKFKTKSKTPTSNSNEYQYTDIEQMLRNK